MRRRSNRIMVALLFSLGICMARGIPKIVVEVSGQPQVPYNLGGWTYISKPVYPIKINATQIPIGENWTYVCNLNAGSLYHVYFYGDWIDYNPLANKTDYDVFVYNPLGELESMHTESAGLPEHLGTTVDAPFFIPKYSGEYSFLLKNDAKESRGEDEGTLMIIEHLECDHWYELYLGGKIDDEPTWNTSWAYEFTTSSERVEVIVEVPDTLDMYEAQLYLMANPSQGVGTILNGVPLAWEPGLYGETDPSAVYGGYRLDAEGFSHSNASASCEYLGQDMLISYEPPSGGDIFLYHLSLIAETGEGVLRYIFKTDFEAPSLSIPNPVERSYSDYDTTITALASDEESGLETVLLEYSLDNWETRTAIEMSPSQDDTYTAKIPRQSAGTTVKYKVTAADTAGNTAEEEGTYEVKDLTIITITLSKPVLQGGETLKVNGWFSQGSVAVVLDYACQDFHVSRTTTANATGFYAGEYTPEKSGVWTVSARWSGDEEHFEAFSGYESFTVEKASATVSCYIDKKAIGIGENVEITGSIYPSSDSLRVSLNFAKPDGTTTERYAYTSSNGSFNLIYTPDLPGPWSLQAKVVEDELHHPSSSSDISFVVHDTWINEYNLYIIASGVGAAILVLVVFLRSRGGEEFEEEME
ncbi:MAG: hypothetical protein NWF14_09010 [Candidatus Bathyarchaeota archaeon]|nr:hypothetical protein [Candidatus Bathyarchaeota archaeon]